MLQRREQELTTRCLAGLVAAALLAMASPTASAGDAVGTTVLVDTPDRIVIEYRFGTFGETAVDVDGVEYSQLALGKEARRQDRGDPALPRVCRSVIVPDDASMAVRVLDSRSYLVEGVLVAPSKGVIYRNQNPEDIPWEFGKAYKTDAFYPGELASLREPYILRDHRGVVVEVNPLQYNPVSQTLRVYSEVTVEVTPSGPAQLNQAVPRGDARELSLAFHKVYSHHFLNYGLGARYAPLDEAGDMLVICHDAWLPNIQPLVDHKNGIGLSTTAVGVSAIGNNATAIGNYIQSVYDTSDLAFVLLVGDSAQVASPSSAGGSADPTYALVAGGDNYPDIFIGRFSAETADDVDTQVLRTVEYEQLQSTTQPWFKQALGIASDEGGPGQGDDDESDVEHMDNIRTDLLGHGYTTVDQVYDPGATAAEVSAAVNAGLGLINYVGHGSTTSWLTSGFNVGSVNSLTNDNMLPFIITVACVNGQFAGYTCFAEAWMRATNGGEPTGAVGIYASSINQSWASPMCGQDESNDLLVGEAYVSFGALCFAGSCQMMDEYGADGRNMFDTWHVFGDPSLRVVGTTAPPTGLWVSPGTGLSAAGQAGGPFSPDSIEYTLENLNDTAIDYAISAGAPWVSLSETAGTLPAYGTAAMTVSINSLAATLGNGHYGDTIEFVNTTDGDGGASRNVSLQVGVPEVVYAYPLDSDPGWSVEGEWAFGAPAGGGGGSFGDPDPTSGATGDYVYGYDLLGDYSAEIGGPYYLTTGPLDFTDYEDVTLRFQRWLNTDYQPYVEAGIEVSNDGTNWTSIWDNGSSTISATAWSQFEYDISPVADGEAAVYVRWYHQVGSSGAFAYSGWNIDDIEFWGLGGWQPPATIELGYSCVEHDLAGEFCMPLGTGDDRGRGDNAEPRLHAVSELEFDTSAPVEEFSATVACQKATDFVTAVVAIADGGNSIAVQFDPPLPADDCCTVSFSGGVVGDYAIATLQGDVNRDLVVNTTDFSAVKARFGQVTDAANFRYDTNADGVINTLDSSAIKARFGASVPNCP